MANTPPASESADGLDENGDSYIHWRARRLEPQYRQTLIRNIPGGIAQHAGCPADSGIRLKVREPAGAGVVSLRWCLHAASSATVGGLRGVIAAMDLHEDEWLRVIVGRG